MRVGALMRVGRSYSSQNQLFVQQLDMLVETVRPHLREYGEFLFVAYGGEVFLDGTRVAMTSHGFRMAKALIGELDKRNISGFEVRGEPDQAEWRRFFELLLDADAARGDALLAAAHERGLERILPVVRVLEDPSDDATNESGLGAGTTAGPEAQLDQRDPSAMPVGSTGAASGATSPSTAALGAAPKHYAAALSGLQSLLTSTTAQRGLEFRHARRVVQPIVDSATSTDPIVLGLAGMIKRDGFTYARNVNACLIATAIGHRLGFDRQTLADLSMAALLHGIGRSVTEDPARIGCAGALILARRATLQATTVKVMRVAFEASSGRALPGRSSVLSQIVSIAAAYARMISARGDVGKSTTPAQALGMIVGPLTGGFDPWLKLALIEVLGIHPPGQFVELDDGTIAMVIAPNRDDIARPILHPVTGPAGRSFDPQLHWAGGTLPAERTVARDLLGFDVPADLDHAA